MKFNIGYDYEDDEMVFTALAFDQDNKPIGYIYPLPATLPISELLTKGMEIRDGR